MVTTQLRHMTTNRAIFDADDVQRILFIDDDGANETPTRVWRFTISELRQQIDTADIKASVCRTYGEDDKADFYEDLRDAMDLALDIQRSNRPKPTQHRGGHQVDADAIKVNNDIVTVAERYTPIRKAGRNFTGKCLLHESKGWPLTIYPDSQSFYCFHCLAGGDVIRFVMLMGNVDFKGAAESLK